MSATLCVLGAFALIVILTRLKAPLSLAILAGTAAVGLLFGQGAWELIRMATGGAVHPGTLWLVSVTTLLLGLSGLMHQTGQLARIVTLAKALLRRPAVTMAALPAMIGLLPMPGGALFSAPMVGAAAGEHKPAGGVLSAINFWYRHIWEHWWPLYPGVLVAAGTAGSSLGAFAAFQAPLGAFMIVSGLLLFRRLHPSLRARAATAPAGTARELLAETSSIWVILPAWAAARFLVAAWLDRWPCGSEAFRQATGKYLPVAAGLVVTLAWTMRFKHVELRAVGRIFARRNIYALAGLVVSIMVFKHVLSGVHAAHDVGQELQEMKVPTAVVAAALPLVAGVVTGTAIGFVGTAFPIVVGLVSTALPEGAAARPYWVLAYAFGHLGQLLSPIHVCLVVSNQHFETPFGPVYRRMLPTAAVNAVLVVAYFLLLRWVM